MMPFKFSNVMFVAAAQWQTSDVCYDPVCRNAADSLIGAGEGWSNTPQQKMTTSTLIVGRNHFRIEVL